MAAKKKNFALAVQRMESIVEEMEKLETPLEEALRLYREGMALAKQCNEILNEAVKEVTVLQQSAEGFFEEKLFDGDGGW